jgi:hypothetical protein
MNQQVPDITNLKARITDAFATVIEDMLENTWREIDYRLDVLRATRGAHNAGIVVSHRLTQQSKNIYIQ